MQNIVQTSRAPLTSKQLEGFDTNNPYDSVARFADARWFCALDRNNNDFDDDFHIDLFSSIVIWPWFQRKKGHRSHQHKIYWLFMNRLSAIATCCHGWMFQLNAVATFNFCWTALLISGRHGRVQCELSRRSESPPWLFCITQKAILPTQAHSISGRRPCFYYLILVPVLTWTARYVQECLSPKITSVSPSLFTPMISNLESFLWIQCSAIRSKASAISHPKFTFLTSTLMPRCARPFS